MHRGLSVYTLIKNNDYENLRFLYHIHVVTA